MSLSGKQFIWAGRAFSVGSVSPWQAGDETFVIRDRKTDAPTTIRYADVAGLEPPFGSHPPPQAGCPLGDPGPLAVVPFARKLQHGDTEDTERHGELSLFRQTLNRATAVTTESTACRPLRGLRFNRSNPGLRSQSVAPPWALCFRPASQALDGISQLD